MSSVVCCLVPGLSWPWFELPGIVSAWEASFHFSSRVILCLAPALLAYMREGSGPPAGESPGVQIAGRVLRDAARLGGGGGYLLGTGSHNFSSASVAAVW